ncbi:MAG: DEAD/DEAH box helicase family protein, partial [Lachnospiraceae bacterium]
MDHFKAVHFHGQFRSYQAKVLDHADQYLKDGKINIVAAPGSGKTVLGLELIRRIGEPCVILSPTTAIREQWGDRFRTMFLDDQSLFPELFSNDLHKLRLMNSITYQALYTAIEKKPVETEEDTDCSDIDIFQTIRDHGIRTICLDEAHHLKNEWQRALETFMGQLDGDMKVIALTATPPYDSDGSEWERYQKVCGEIDEEIFVPELVAQNTLCPHQDYVYFSYPTQAEQDMLQEYKKNAALAVEEMGRMPVFSTICRNLNASRDYEILFASAKEYIALLVLLQKFGFPISKRIVKQMTAGRGLPSFQMKYAETAIQFLLDGELLAEDEKLKIVELLKNYQVYSKRRVALDLNEKLKKTLISSTGKLESIRQIADCEFSNMGSQLRMLVLTDYIKKEDVPKIATGEELTSVSVVSIFETIRKGNEAVNIGVLSGSLVILPDTIDLSGVKHKRQHIEGTRYSVVDIAGSNHETVGLVGKLFKTGAIQILVGTKSLLGEGWDSPCINSLILASFVGSFVLSNQMRGRAIRIDKNNPDKTGNIWHLVSVEPEYIYKDKAVERLGAYWNQDKEQLTSCDYEMLKRRFDAFMGPNYTTGVIESGIERITAIAPPYDQKGIERINREMLSRASDRAGIAAQWDGEVADGRFQVAVETQVPTEKKVPIFTFINFGFMV